MYLQYIGQPVFNRHLNTYQPRAAQAPQQLNIDLVEAREFGMLASVEHRAVDTTDHHVHVAQAKTPPKARSVELQYDHISVVAELDRSRNHLILGVPLNHRLEQLLAVGLGADDPASPKEWQRREA